MMSGGIKERVSVRVSLVIAAIDDFTGRPVRPGQLRVWAEGERQPVRKEDGYFIFTNLRSDQTVIHLEGPVFHTQEIVFDEQKRIQYEGKILKVRMLPNRSYPIPRNTTCVQGHAAPGSLILAYNKTLKEPLKLLYPYEAGQEEIHIFHPEDMDLEGKLFYIRNKEDTQQEVFQIVRQTDDADQEKKSYQLSPPLGGSYKKIGTAVYPVYVSRADQAGEFYLPAAGIYTEKAVFAFWLEGNEQKQTDIELQNGKVNVCTEIPG